MKPYIARYPIPDRRLNRLAGEILTILYGL